MVILTTEGSVDLRDIDEFFVRTGCCDGLSFGRKIAIYDATPNVRQFTIGRAAIGANA
jgi:hypothetical protein